MSRLAALLATFALAASVSAQGPVPDVRPPAGLPEQLVGVGIDQRLGEAVPLDLEFRDSTGRTVRLGELIDDRPVVLALVYYECPMLCGQVLNGLATSLEALSFDVGDEFDVITVSFDAREDSAAAARSKASYVGRYGRDGAEAGWHSLTGEQAAIDALTRATGFRYRWDEATEQFAHASGIMVLTPDGRLARYFFGIEYPSRDVRLGLIEASERRIGNPVDSLLLYCYRYDPATGRYGAVVMNMVRVGGVVTLIGMLLLILLLRRRTPAHGPVAGAEGR